MNQLTVILPTLNEAGNVEVLARRIWESVPGSQVIVSDDNSTDGTREIVRRMEQEGLPIRLHARTGKPCLTDSIWEGIVAAKTEYVAWMDADLSHPPEYLPKLFAEAQRTGCSIATRFVKGAERKKASRDTPDSAFAVLLSVVMNFLVRKWLRLSITDYTSGFIVVRRDLIKHHRLVGDYGEYFIELMYFLSRQGVKITEIPYISPARVWGESKTGASLGLLFRRGLKYLFLIPRISPLYPQGLARKIRHWRHGGELAVIHEFHRPPYGGGNQFLLALIEELKRQGHDVSQNSVGKNTRVLLVNSFNFDFDEIRRYKGQNLKIVHRVDGPISVYRSLPDSAVDQRIADWNNEMADATIFQSRYSQDMHAQLGIHFRNPTIISNAVDPQYFYPPATRAAEPGRKIRIAGTSWSTNPKKGLALYSWLDENLDFSRFELSFLGRIDAKFKNVKAHPAVGTAAVGAFLREQDIYFMPSENECCSNALIEALTTGLPAVYIDSGSSPELVQGGGEPFREKEELPALFAKVASQLPAYREKIRVKSITEIAEAYAAMLGIER